MRCPLIIAAIAVAACVGVGCNKKGADADVAPLEKAFGAKSAAGSPDRQQVAELVAAATEAAKNNDYPKAAASLSVLRAQPALTPDQRAAVQDAMGNIQSEMARRVEAGDAAAIQAQDAIREMKKR